jgi:molybdenum cofactor biosynthesis enzyme MoaA
VTIKQSSTLHVSLATRCDYQALYCKPSEQEHCTIKHPFALLLLLSHANDVAAISHQPSAI